MPLPCRHKGGCACPPLHHATFCPGASLGKRHGATSMDFAARRARHTRTVPGASSDVMEGLPRELVVARPLCCSHTCPRRLFDNHHYTDVRLPWTTSLYPYRYILTRYQHHVATARELRWRCVRACCDIDRRAGRVCHLSRARRGRRQTQCSARSPAISGHRRQRTPCAARRRCRALLPRSLSFRALPLSATPAPPFFRRAHCLTSCDNALSYALRRSACCTRLRSVTCA